MNEKDDDFLSRWSRRKRNPAEEEDSKKLIDQSSEPTGATALNEFSAPDPQADQILLDELGLKKPEDLQPGEEFATFLRASIPRHLKQRALRRLWTSNPLLANLDGLNDYDGDFTGGGVGPGELKTAYRVGKGFVKNILSASEVSETDGSETSTDADVVGDSEEIDQQIPIETDPENPTTQSFIARPSNEQSDAKKRMAFRFSNTD